MKKILLILILPLLTVLTALTQSVSDVNFLQVGQKISITYNLVGAKFNQSFSVSLYVSVDGGKTFRGPLKNVTGDVGSNITSGSNKKISWEVFEEMPDFGGEIVFNVKAIVIEDKIKPHYYVGLKGSQSAPLGIVAGRTGKVGFYASARINLRYFNQPAYETDGITIKNYSGSGYYSFTSNEETQRLSATAGLQFQTGRRFHIYVGGGFAQYSLLWEVNENQYGSDQTSTSWAKHTGESFNSFEVEAGLFLSFKHVFVSVGASSPGFQWIDGIIGAGYIF